MLWKPYEVCYSHPIKTFKPSDKRPFRPYGRDEVAPLTPSTDIQDNRLSIFFPNRDSYFSGDSTIRPRGGFLVSYNPVIVTVDPRSSWGSRSRVLSSRFKKDPIPGCSGSIKASSSNCLWLFGQDIATHFTHGPYIHGTVSYWSPRR